MRLSGGRSVCLAFMVSAVAACSADIHGNAVEIPNAKIDVETAASVDVDNVTPAETVPLTVNVQNVYLIEPTQTPPPEHVNDACHLQVYLDDYTKPPLLVTAQTNISVPVPPDTKPGKHKFLCRVHKHDGTPTTTVFEVNINVKVDVTTGGTGGTAGAPGTGASTGTAGAPGTGGTTGAAGAGGAAGAAGAAGAGGSTGSGGASGAAGSSGTGGAPGVDAGAPPTDAAPVGTPDAAPTPAPADAGPSGG